MARSPTSCGAIPSGRRGRGRIRSSGSTVPIGPAFCRAAAADRIIDDAWSDLALGVSGVTRSRTALVCHEDTSGASAYRVYENGQLVESFEEGTEDLAEEIAGADPDVAAELPATFASGAFVSRRGRAVSESDMQNGYKVLRDLAEFEHFQALNYGPGPRKRGEPFRFEILGMRTKVAEVAFVTT